ncbi:unnamed protein product [Cyprideis torosa]|uniref:Ribitol-5-phosphate transferase FKTN N-terminal domain-containing protein n=1 Tax=Cyprideis torosa TaxID=163714 RepID=A0A7R8WIT2_9CRUS|nr:unnamed protein product [Cyprideis torosa]CAG0901132.1 unnamed protein product [Cyprideis torosa]
MVKVLKFLWWALNCGAVIATYLWGIEYILEFLDIHRHSSVFPIMKHAIDSIQKAGYSLILVDRKLLRFEDGSQIVTSILHLSSVTFAVELDFESGSNLLRDTVVPGFDCHSSKGFIQGYGLVETHKIWTRQVNSSDELDNPLFPSILVVHVVLLYRRKPQFLWFGPMNFTADVVPSSWNISLDPWTHSGAVPWFYKRPLTVDGLRIYMPVNHSKFMTDLTTSTFLECDNALAQQWKRQHGVQETRELKAKRHIFYKVISRAQVALESLSIPFWLAAGTLLGHCRQCDVISHTTDVDIGVFAEDYHPSIVAQMERMGLKLIHSFGRVNDSLELSFWYEEHGLKLDIFFFYPDPDLDVYWNGAIDAETGEKFRYDFEKFDLCWTLFLGELLVRVPCETERYIEANYGKDWRQEVKEFDWRSSPANVRKNGFWRPEEFQEVIQMFWYKEEL